MASAPSRFKVLHAQAKPPIYYVADNELTNPEAYSKEYAPRQADLIRASGGRYLVAGGKTTAFDGEPPKGRFVITVWDSIEKSPGVALFCCVQGTPANRRKVCEIPGLRRRGRVELAVSQIFAGCIEVA
jgi:uncharacterized protein (DUF1330 family)